MLDQNRSFLASYDFVHLNSCAFDGKGNFHAAYLSKGRLRYLYGPVSSLREMRVAKPASSENPSLPEGWRFETIPLTPNKEGHHLALSLDNQGRPHVFYFSLNGLQHVVLTSSGWAVGTITDKVNIVKPWSVTMNAAGVPVVASEGQPGRMVTMQPTASGWKEDPLPETKTKRNGTIHCLKINFKADGSAHLAFLEQYGHIVTLWYAKRGIQWSSAHSIFSFVEHPLTRCQVDIDAQDRPHAAYLAWANPGWDGTENLVYIHPDKKGRWRRGLAPVPVVTGSSRMALDFLLDDSNKPHFVHYSAGPSVLSRGLMYSSHESKKWSRFILDMRVEMAGNPSLAVDPEGNPWILYQDNNNDTLKLAFRKQISK